MSQEFVKLIEANAILSRQLEAKEKRIRTLEFLLEQRFRETKRQYDPEHVEEMKDRVYRLFLDRAGVSFTYEEAEAEFQHVYGFRSANVPQRLRDLRKEGKLWSADNESGKVRFYLKLAELQKATIP